MTPIRMTRNNWQIPLYCYHECSDNYCSTIDEYYQEELFDFVVRGTNNENYKDGKCKQYHKVLPTYIHLSTFNFSNPMGEEGVLYEPDLIVIPDQEFTLQVDFPLEYVTEFTVKSPHKDVTLRTLLYLIQSVYTDVYRIEEETATDQSYTLSRDCNCVNVSLLDIINQRKTISTSEMDCSICYSPMDDISTILECKHEFHSECLSMWVTKGNGEKCPLCRASLYNCGECGNTGRVDFEFKGKVIPPHLRNTPYRNATDGVFGIRHYDFDQLIIVQMMYNRVQKKLYLEMGIY